MARIKGIDLPNEKRIEIALTYIYGIGRQLSRKILTNAKVNFDTKAKDITEDELTRIRDEVNKRIFFFSSDTLHHYTASVGIGT